MPANPFLACQADQAWLPAHNVPLGGIRSSTPSSANGHPACSRHSAGQSLHAGPLPPEQRRPGRMPYTDLSRSSLRLPHPTVGPTVGNRQTRPRPPRQQVPRGEHQAHVLLNEQGRDADGPAAETAPGAHTRRVQPGCAVIVAAPLRNSPEALVRL